MPAFFRTALALTTAFADPLNNQSVLREVQNNQNSLNIARRVATPVGGGFKPSLIIKKRRAPSLNNKPSSNAENIAPPITPRSKSEANYMPIKRAALRTPRAASDKKKAKKPTTVAKQPVVPAADNYSSLLRKARGKKIIVRRNEDMVVSFDLLDIMEEYKFLQGQTVKIVDRNYDLRRQQRVESFGKRKTKRTDKIINEFGNHKLVQVYVPFDGTYRILPTQWLVTKKGWHAVQYLRAHINDEDALRKELPSIKDANAISMFEQQLWNLGAPFEEGDFVCMRDENSPFAHTKATVEGEPYHHYDTNQKMVMIRIEGEIKHFHVEEIKHWRLDEYQQHMIDEIMMAV